MVSTSITCRSSLLWLLKPIKACPRYFALSIFIFHCCHGSDVNNQTVWLRTSQDVMRNDVADVHVAATIFVIVLKPV